MPTHNVTVSWSRSGEAVSQTMALTGSGEVNIDEDIAASQTDKAVTCAVDVSALKSLFILSTEDCTIETNSGAAADDTLTLTADVPLVWYTGCGHANPLSADVTGLYVTNTTALTLKFRALQDATP